ncbi:eukaryotic porin/Tom40 [Podospora australis]|uniref:Eukaryotic porin/Tom40 n=1 Tax=Podospora australis TaxID=1536484 RepID=A0AAN6WWV5_9PEZI|nr:eukaryotic porin/Tom40 [Podospora australis]
MASTTDAPLAFLQNNPVFTGLSDVYGSFQERRAKLGLSNPGTVENIAKEVQRDVLATNQMFWGLRAELTKAFSFNPLFQVSHQFAIGERMNPYTFASLYGSNRIFAQGNVDDTGSFMGRFNWRWGPDSAHVSKAMVQLTPAGGMAQDVAQIEHEYTGADFTASVKAMNPSILEGGLTGTMIGHYMQSVTPRLSLGIEAVWQRIGLTQPPDTAISYVGRYKAEDWIASVQLQAQGALNTSYWRRISEKVQAGVDMTLSVAPANPMMGGGMSKEGTTTFGAKYDFRMSTFRAQVDSKGKLACMLEKRIGPVIMMSVALDVEPATKQSKIGLGVSIEASPEMDEATQQEMMASQPAANIPF